jgi:hypothetical protein
MNTTITSTIDQTENSRLQMKNWLKNQIQEPFILGNNQIKIKKVSDKYVEIEELFNGFEQHTKTRYTIETAFKYWKYRTFQMLHWPIDEDYHNIENQTDQYKIQIENIEEIKSELNNHIQVTCLDECRIYSTEPKVVFLENEIKIHLDSGATFTITTELDEIDEPRPTLKYSLSNSFDEINSKKHFNDVVMLKAIGRLLYYNDRISKDFLDVFHRYLMCTKNLRKLWVEPTKNINPVLLEDLHNFIVNAPVEHKFQYELSPVGQFKRYVEIEKVTRIRTMIHVIAENEDDKFIELEAKINKITHNIEENAKTIGKLVEAHNY